MLARLFALLTALSAAASAQAAEIYVAAAANFAEPAKEIARAFEAETGHRVILSVGSTGQLYAQIAQGAPYEVFLAADQARPERAEAEGLAEPGARFTYAVGRLALWSAEPGRVTGPETLSAAAFDRLAIAEPKTAPYGFAAMQTLEALGLAESLQPRIVRGVSVSQTHQFVASGAAEIGFIGYSQIIAGTRRGLPEGSVWLPPADLYAPIRQDAALIATAGPAARAFYAYLRGPQAAAVIAEYGYLPGDAQKTREAQGTQEAAKEAQEDAPEADDAAEAPAR